MRRFKLISGMLAVFAIAAAMTVSGLIKNYSVKQLYEDVIFTQITMESKQSVSDIEYGIKYGRQLESFYNMEDTLKSIEQNSSYIDADYIASAGKKLLYSNGSTAAEGDLYIPAKIGQSADKPYQQYRQGGNYFLVTRIKNGSGATSGYLIIRVRGDAVTNASADDCRQNAIQSIIIGGELMAIALLVIRGAKKGKTALLRMLAVLLVLSIVLDAGVTLLRYHDIASNATTQTVDKIVQSLQSEVTQVEEKGVPSDRIYDLNGWLEKSKSDMPVISSFTVDNNDKIVATVSQKYVNGFLYQAILRFAALLAVSLLLCASTMLIYFYIQKRRLPSVSSKGIRHFTEGDSIGNDV